MPRPVVTPRFEAEMKIIGGQKNGHDRFRIVWGCSEEIYVEGFSSIESGWYLKYQLCTTGKRLVGYKWGEGGKNHFAKTLSGVPKHILTALPVYRMEQVGTPRWILEEWRDEGEQNGFFDSPGYYFHRMIVADDQPDNPDTYLKPYREPGELDLEKLRHYVQLTASLTDEETKRGVEREREQEAKEAANLTRARRESYTEAFVEMAERAPKNLTVPTPDLSLKQIMERVRTEMRAEEKETI